MRRFLAAIFVWLSSSVALAQMPGSVPLGAPAAPPPASVTTPAGLLGVPPTPAPAFPGLPTTPVSPSTPSTTGLGAGAQNELRPSVAGTPDQVAALQSALTQQGFFRGPVDGQLTAGTRASVRAFQASASLPITGELDAQTAAAIGVTTNVLQTPAVLTPPFSATGSAAGSTSFPLSTPGAVRPFPQPPIFVQP